MNKSVKRNYIYNLIYEIFALITPLITTPYVSPILGAEGIGTYSFTLSIATYFTYLSALGTTTYARREIAYLQDDKDARSKLFWEVFVLRFITTSISMAIYTCYCLFWGNSIIPWIQGAYILAILFDVTWLYQGMEDFGTVVLRNIIIKIVGIAFIFIFVKKETDLVIYILGFAIIQIVSMASLWMGVPKYISSPFKYKLDLKRHLRPALALFLPTIAAQVYLLLDKTMIGIFTETNVENGYYEQTQKIVRICYTVIITMGTVMAPRIASCFSNNNLKALKEYMRKSFRFVWLLALPISFGLFAISNSLVPWFFGPGYEKVSLLLKIFCWVTVPIGLSAVTGSAYLIQARQQKYYNISVISAAILNLILNLVLIPSLLSVGAAIASLIAEICIVLIQIVSIIKITKDFSIRDIFCGFIKYFIAAIIMFIVVMICSNYVPASILGTFSLVVLGAICYFVFLCIFQDKLVFDYIKSLLVRIRKKH